MFGSPYCSEGYRLHRKRGEGKKKVRQCFALLAKIRGRGRGGKKVHCTDPLSLRE